MSRRRSQAPRAWSALGLLASLLAPAGGRPAHAFTIASGFSDSCHERLGLAAMAVLIDDLPADDLVVPPDGLWRDVAAELAPLLLDTGALAAAATMTDAQKFVLFSLVVGIRSPDTGGHSVANLTDLRNEQIDPSPDSQHLHCLRAPAEDGFAGDVAVLDGSQALMRSTLAGGLAAVSAGRSDVEAPFYLDFYGQLEVEVDPLSYAIGRAMHTLQDCYAHTLRSPDGQTVFSVLNYIEAVAGTLDEARDGMAHSDALDDCRKPELAPLVSRATAVSLALARAAAALATTGDPTLLDKGFGACAAGETDTASCAWMQYIAACQPAAQTPDTAACCSQANAYCGSPFLGVARTDLTKPYIQEVLTCAVSPGSARPDAGRWPAIGALAGVLLSLRRRRRRRSNATGLAVAFAAGISPGPAAAEQTPTYRPDRAFAEVEGHASLLSDAPERSFINATMGYGIRGGYRLRRWGLVAQVERNYWLPTELSHALVAGALNIGAGAEWFAFDGRVRLSAVAGPSILWFDAAFNSKGTTGLFVDLRPSGLRWRPSRSIAVSFDPLSLALVAPVLGSPGIVQLEYRTLLGLELLP